MNYKLKFLPTALKEWKKLDNSMQSQFKKKLSERLEKPHVSSSKLSGLENHYKIKLRASGYRLVYEVIDNELFVLVIAMEKETEIEFIKKLKKDNLVNELSEVVCQENTTSAYVAFNNLSTELSQYLPQIKGSSRLLTLVVSSLARSSCKAYPPEPPVLTASGRQQILGVKSHISYLAVSRTTVSRAVKSLHVKCKA